MILRVPQVTSREAARWAVAISASAGGIAALIAILDDLPPTFAAAVLVVQHLMPHRESHLAQVLGWHTQLEVAQARSSMRLRRGTVYVAPPDAHLMIGPGSRVTLSHRPPVHFCRPSGDRLFESLAVVFGPRAVAVVLTGFGRDGAAGAQRVRRCGGTVIVQDPATAEHGDMPRAAIRAGAVDYVLPLGQIGGMLETLIAAGAAA